MSVFSDKSTNHVLGVGSFVARLSPDSRAGARLAKELKTYAPPNASSPSPDPAREKISSLDAEIGKLRTVDRWIAATPDAFAQVRKALAELPELERPARQLRAEQVLGEAELFCVKQFLYYATAIFESAPALLFDPGYDPTVGPDDAAKAAQIMTAIHPQKNPTPRFHLAAELSAELESARVALRQNKKVARHLRLELESAVVAQYGGRFDIQGHFRGPGDLDIADDPRLKRAQQSIRLTDPQLNALRTKIERLQQAIETHEYALRERLSLQLRPSTQWLVDLERALAKLDMRLAKCRLRRELKGCWAKRRGTPGSRIEQGREPGILAALEAQEASVQPIDLELDTRPTVVSGPNMGGKSVLLRLIGLCHWCAQHAMPVPAAHFEFWPVSGIIYVGAEENIDRSNTAGLSSFGREVQRLVDFWDAPDDAARLWLLDEVGRGTHPDEGAEIAYDVIENLAAHGDRVVAATHFPRVAAMKSALKLRIAGLRDPAKLEALLADESMDVHNALRAAMDYRPVCADTKVPSLSGVPRDARLVARALGLKLGRKLPENSNPSDQRDENHDG